MEAEVRSLLLNKGVCHTHLRSYHFKNWLREAYLAEGTSTLPNKDRCRNLVDLTQYTCYNGEITMDMSWIIIVLVPNVNTDTWGVGFLETLWKMVEAIIDNRLKSCINFHDVLHGFCAGRGMGAAILELKLAHELVKIYQYPLSLVFLDRRKEYDNLELIRLLTTMEGYGAGTHICGILAEFWEHQEVVTRKNGYHGPCFQGKGRKPQGGLILSTLFNMVVENVLHNYLSMTIKDKLFAHDGLGLTLGRCMGMFDADEVLVGSQKPECLQGALTVIIVLF